jgi:hypothetical protein
MIQLAGEVMVPIKINDKNIKEDNIPRVGLFVGAKVGAAPVNSRYQSPVRSGYK